MRIELIDHMGSDLTVVNAARVSFDKHSEELKLEDERLISYLARHDHWTPFSHCTITLRETVPIFVARQRFKHTVGFTYNEVSRRYVDDSPDFYTPAKWRSRPTGSAKQGSGEGEVSSMNVYPDKGMRPPQQTIKISKAYSDHLEQCSWIYNQMIEAGVAPEQARMVLPQSMYTSYYCTGSLMAFARAYKLRSDPHAQLEIQYVAKDWDRIIRPLYPASWSALTSTS